MVRNMFAGLIAVALLLGPLPLLPLSAMVQSAHAATQVNPKKAKRPLSPAQQALRARMKKCGAQWRAAKAAGEIKKGMKWPQYWSECNKRLKLGG